MGVDTGVHCPDCIALAIQANKNLNDPDSKKVDCNAVHFFTLFNRFQRLCHIDILELKIEDKVYSHG